MDTWVLQSPSPLQSDTLGRNLTVADSQVEELLGRLRGVLPQAPWLGGVLQPAAWGAGASLRGALFLNSHTFDEGAVGCMLRGPLRFDQLCWQVGPWCPLRTIGALAASASRRHLAHHPHDLHRLHDACGCFEER